MKVIIGIDENGDYESSVKLLSWLELDSPEVALVHVDDSNILSGKRDFSYVSEFELAQLDFEEALLEKAEHFCKKWGFSTSKSILHGSPAKLLVEQARKDKADIVCVGAKRRSKFNSSLFGSVGRALAISSNRSVLIAKSTLSPDGPFTVVVTTDHSEYSDKALKLLLKLKPKGIQRLILLTAYTPNPRGHADGTNEATRKSIEEKSKSTVNKLFRKGIPAEYRVIEGDLGEVVEAQMDAVKGDLLIMGAQGEGHIGMMSIGSSALKQVVSSKHSILLLRP